MKKKIPVYRITLKNEEKTGVNLVSFVGNPAIQSGFIALKSQAPKPATRSNIKLSDLDPAVSKIELITGQVINIHPVTRRLTFADGGVLGTGTYLLKDGSNFTVEASQSITEIQKPTLTPGKQRLAACRAYNKKQ